MDIIAGMHKRIKALRIRRKTKTACKHLHYDILQDIFRFLDSATLRRCAEVCHYWREAAYHPCLWKGSVCKVQIGKWSPTLAHSLKLRGISAVAILVEDPDIDSRQFVNQSDGENKESRDQRLTEHKERMYIMMEQCSEILQLRTLIYTGGYQWNMPAQFHSLTCLVLCNIEMNESGLQQILLPLVNLTKLHINNQQREEFEGRALYKRGIMSFNCLKVSFTSRPNLKDLEVVGMSFAYCFPIEVVPSDVTYRGLQRLSLIDAISLSEHFLLQIAQKLPQLKHLVFAFYCNGHNLPFQPQFPELESLHVIDCEGDDSYSQLFTVFRATPQLKALDVSIQTSQLTAISRLGSDLPFGHHFGLSESNVRQLILSFPKLKVLNISGNQGITTGAINDIFVNLNNIEVFIALQLHFNPSELKLNSPHLRSFLADIDPEFLRCIPSLRYRYHNSSIQTRVSGDQQLHTDYCDIWTEVLAGSNGWHKAHGTNFFYPPHINYVCTQDGRWDFKTTD